MNIIINIENELAMAKRARLLTAEDVLDELDLEDDYDDFDKPMIPGSDDEFDDCDLVDEDENDSDGEQTTPPSPTQQASSATPPLPTDWSSSLTSPSVISTPRWVLLCQSLRQPLRCLT